MVSLKTLTGTIHRWSLSTTTFAADGIDFIIENRPQSLQKNFFRVTTDWIAACTVITIDNRILKYLDIRPPINQPL